MRDQREIREREDRNKECPFARQLSTSLKPTTLHIYIYIYIKAKMLESV